MPIDTTRLLQAASGELAAGDQEVEDPDGIDIDRLLRAIGTARATTDKRGRTTVKEKDLGIGGAFAAGLKGGIIEPFRLLGAESEEVTLDETSEQVANFLGSMVGLGISFIPFAFGTGIALRGLGLTAKIAGAGVTAQEVARSQALFNFVRNTAAGSIQFAGTSETVGQVPGRAAAGAAFGAAIEGVFLARAMRGRRGGVSKEQLFDTGNPVVDVPNDLDKLVLEMEISPSTNKTVEQMTRELNSTFTENRPWEEVIVDLLGEHVETFRGTGFSKEGADNVLAYARTTHPNAQRLIRPTQVKGVHEVLIHEPFDPANILTKRQVDEWKATGFASGEELIYANTRVEATGGISPRPGTVSVRSPLSQGTKEGVPFLVPIEEVTRPTTTRFFNKSAGRTQTLQAAIESLDDRVGFVIPASAVGRGAAVSARRGFADVAEFETAASFDDFAKPFLDDLGNVQAASPEEGVGILASRAGIPGLRVLDEGATIRVHIFDQGKVSYIDTPPRVAKSPSEVGTIEGVRQGILPSDVGAEAIRAEAERRVATQVQRRAQALAFEGAERRTGVGRRPGDPGVDIARLEAGVTGRPREVPNLGLVLDNAVFNANGELLSFAPSWRNKISAPLQEAGFPQKEIDNFLDLYRINQTRRLDSLMEPEFQAIKNASIVQFGGCP